MRAPARSLARSQRGLSLVELMVGITVGLFVVAAAATMVATQLGDNRRLMLETQVQQDLRASSEIIARDVRRAGLTGQPFNAPATVWRPGDTTDMASNRNLPVAPAVNGAVANTVSYSVTRVGGDGPWGFRLNGNVIEAMFVGIGAGWQPLTDPTTMQVVQFDITAVNQPPIQLACQTLCAPPLGPRACWPTVEVRAFQIDIEGVATSDPSVRRRVRQLVHLRNDAVQMNDPAIPTRSCPP